MSVKDIIILGCSSQQPTRSRNHGAYLVRWNGEGLLFDPGEGTQRQFIFANTAPTCVNRIFVSHFHGDHCLGLGSMFMRLNLDKIEHPIHCYYPKSGKKYFDRLRYCCSYHEKIKIIEHPVDKEGIVDESENFVIKATFLKHGIDNIGWRVVEKDKIKYKKELLDKYKVKGPLVKKLEKDKEIEIDEKKVLLKDVSYIKKGDSLSVIIDTKMYPALVDFVKDSTILICESTYLDIDSHLAKKYMHMSAKEAAFLAKKANVKKLIVTHFSARYSDLKDFEKEIKPIFSDVEVAKDLKRIEFPK